MMDFQRKLSEVERNLALMRKEETRGIGQRQYDHHLSGFLSAAYSVTDGMLRQGDPAIAGKFKTWKAALSTEQTILYDFMRTERKAEVHGSGSHRRVKIKQEPIAGSYTDPAGGGTVETSSPPATLGFPAPTAVVEKYEYISTIGGVERKTTEACSEGLALLTEMVRQCLSGVS
jgi:hypothetical protein